MHLTQRSIRLEFDSDPPQHLLQSRGQGETQFPNNPSPRWFSGKGTLDFEAFLQELSKAKADYRDSPGSNIEASFAFSRLYVTLTRAKDNLHFIENEEGLEFLKRLTIGIEDPETSESGLDFFDYDENREISQLETQEEFEPSDDQLFETFELFKRNDEERRNLPW